MTWLIGIAVSYVFALHVVLASMVASHMAVAPSDASTICVTDNSSYQDVPVKKPGGLHRQMACAICAFASISSPLPGDNASLVAPVAFEVIASVSFDIQVKADHRRDPRCTRGPPAKL